MSFISVKDLGHKFNRKDRDGNITGEMWAVKDMNFTAHKGEIIAVLGKNGSGKSTFARHLNGLLAPDKGYVVIQKEDSGVPYNTANEEDLLQIRQLVGMIFQNPENQLVGNTVAEDIGFGLENLGWRADAIWKRIDEVLKLTGMEAYVDRNATRLSGGQKQRLAIASVMAMAPSCIVMDEATSMLDPEGSRQILDTLYQLNREFGISIIMITHRIEETVAADYIYVMDDGEVALSGKPVDIYPQVEKLEALGLESLLAYKVIRSLDLMQIEEHSKRLYTIGDAADMIRKKLHYDVSRKMDNNVSQEMGNDDSLKADSDTRQVTGNEANREMGNNDNAKTDRNACQVTSNEANRKMDDEEWTDGKDKEVSNIRELKKQPIIVAENVDYSYKDGKNLIPAVKKATFQVEKGEILAVAGQTGSGKSTLLSMLNGIYRPMGGSLFVDGVDVCKTKNLKALRKKIGFVFQYPEYQLFENTVLSDVMYGPLNFGMTKEEAETSAKEALSLVNISEDYYDYSPFELSGGQKKRVALAGILAYQPEILILDEPAAGMDSKSKQELFGWIKRLREERAITVIFVSHDMKDVYAIADRLMVMKNGAIIYDGAVEAAIGNPEHAEKLGLSVPELAQFKHLLEPELTLETRDLSEIIDKIEEHLSM